MNFSNFKILNNKQNEAVSAPYGNLLVLAGAGSGKTRVLVHRIAWLLSIKNYSSCSVMAVTFTNKAASEMLYRIKNLIGSSYQTGMWIGTFHGLAHRLLRIHYQEANLKKSFQILDNEDQLSLLKRLIHDMNLDEKKWSPRQAMWYINTKKDKNLRPKNIKNYENPTEETWKRIYQTYQETCNRAGLVDFSELLLLAYELWLKNPDILNYYRKRFTNILVDEFQDTNYAQYAWIRMLAGDQSNVMIVGDDDQSIYGWRGAQVENIQRFLNDFPRSQTICLEQNYRSTNIILQAANALISHNGSRLGKNLWTKGNEGEPITLYCASNELDEACFVVNYIKKINHKKGQNLKDCAILYRRNSQSRVLEEALLQINLPYSIYGGMRFFERQEIKDVLAYLRLIVNRDDDTAYERIVNTPARGLGNYTLNIVRQIAKDRKMTLWQSSLILITEHHLSNRATTSLKRFLDLINSLEKRTSNLPLHVQTDQVIRHSGIWDMYKAEECQKNQTRIENLEELVTATRQFTKKNEEHNLLPLQEFLARSTLEAGEKQTNMQKDAIQLMTLHSSKGLEFPQVFIVGMEEGIFPNKISLRTGEALEEERRLAYVGITRAMKKLTITYAKSRRLYGKETQNQLSRFVNEIPTSCLEKIYSENNRNRKTNFQKLNLTLRDINTTFKPGQQVHHPKFGKGMIINSEDTGKNRRLQIAFQNYGIKWLVEDYARLSTI